MTTLLHVFSPPAALAFALGNSGRIANVPRFPGVELCAKMCRMSTKMCQASRLGGRTGRAHHRSPARRRAEKAPPLPSDGEYETATGGQDMTKARNGRSDDHAFLRPGEFASLKEVGLEMLQREIQDDHRKKLLRLGLIEETSNGLRVTETGIVRMAKGR